MFTKAWFKIIAKIVDTKWLLGYGISLVVKLSDKTDNRV
jgi:hypothetical protein